MRQVNFTHAALVVLVFLSSAAASSPSDTQFETRSTPLMASRSTFKRGTMKLKVSTIGPAPGVVDNPLPSFFWQSLGVEGSMYSYSGPYVGDGVPPLPPLDPRQVVYSSDRADPELERQTDVDGICRGKPCAMKSQRVSLLPWTRQDMWGCEQQVQEVPVIEVENEQIKAIITPQYGGRIWSVYHKKLKRELFMRNPAMQPADYGMRKAWTSGGVEWNWSPGFCGHSTNTLSPVYAATVPSERGDILRVWEFDRTNNTVWQVDMLFEGDTVWVHPRVTNPSSADDINGYFWTNVAQKITVSGMERILIPAKYDYVGVPWPRGNYFLPPDSAVQDAGVDGGIYNFEGLGFGADYSYTGNLPKGHDFFMRLCDNSTVPPVWGGRIPKHCKVVPHREPGMPYIAVVQADGFTVVHGHRGAGTKFFFHERTTGSNFKQRFMAGATPTAANATAPPDSEGVGIYLEAQTGVAPSQSHVFSVLKNSSVEWTEWFRAFRPAEPLAGLNSNYTEALSTVEDWLASDEGLQAAHLAEMERFFDSHSADAIQPHNILATGLPWGGLQESLMGRQMAPGVHFDPPTHFTSDAGDPMVVSAVQSWADLMGPIGTFSSATLSRLPGSFQVSPAWYSKLEQSAASHGATWLHHLFMGTIELEQAHSAQAASSLAKSHASRPNPHAARALALLAPSPPEAWAMYLEGWESLETNGSFADDPMRTAVMDSLAREICQFGLSTEMTSQLRSFVERVPRELQKADVIQYTKAHIAMNTSSDWRTAMKIIEDHCWPTYIGTQHHDLLFKLWSKAAYARFAEEQGVPLKSLTPAQGQLARLQYPPPRNIGGIDRESRKPGKGSSSDAPQDLHQFV